MLSSRQIKYLAQAANINLVLSGNTPIAVSRTSDYNIKVPYQQFAGQMGLDDIRLHWLLGQQNMMAGGAVLNWVWGEERHEDIDFFFESPDGRNDFKLFIENIGFKLSRVSGYAETFFSAESGMIIQLVGRDADKDSYFGDVTTVIGAFDMYVCRWAVDADHVYFTSRAVQDLLRLVIDTTGKEKETGYLRQRGFKYMRKGFFPSPKIIKDSKYKGQNV